MANELQEQVKIQRNNGFERRQKVTAYSPSMQTVLLSRFIRLIWLITGVVDVLIAFRFILKLIAANPGNAFVQFIYRITDVLVGPFVGIVNNPAAGSGAKVDVAALFAMGVYLVVVLVIAYLLRILFASPGGVRQVKTVERVGRDE
jgi:uncharacterized membrane protein